MVLGLARQISCVAGGKPAALPTALTGCTGAVAGAAAPGAAVRRSAAGAVPRAGTGTWASALPAVPSSQEQARAEPDAEVEGDRSGALRSVAHIRLTATQSRLLKGAPVLL